MHIIFLKNFLRSLLFLSVLVCIVLFASYLYRGGKTIATAETATVTRGDVTEKITMTGKVEAKKIAQLSFPTVGVIQTVYKNQGDPVIAGEVLATLVQNSAISEYTATIENIRYYQSTKEELLNGPTVSNRAVTASTVAIAEQDLERATEEHRGLVQVAREDLLSNDITAYPESNTNNDIPPVISGNYRCEKEGDYIVSVYRSGSVTGYSYKLSGLENDLSTAFTDTPHPLGTCGLLIQFDSSESYQNGNWIVSVPNKRSSTYLQKLNSYKLALQNQTNAISKAQQVLELAKRTEVSTNETPRKEALDKINANLSEARALAAAKEAKIADYTIRAPFDGTITENNLKIGETATQKSTMTVVQDGAYDFKIRIPEVDIRKVYIDATVHIAFDANPSELLPGTITYIASNSTEVDGVAYYEAKVSLVHNPDWMRAGLNADVYVTTKEKKDVLRLPQRFIISEADGSYVLTRKELEVVKIPVLVGLTGNDGYVEVSNIEEGTEVILP